MVGYGRIVILKYFRTFCHKYVAPNSRWKLLLNRENFSKKFSARVFHQPNGYLPSEQSRAS